MKTTITETNPQMNNSFQFHHPNFIQLSPLGEFPHPKGIQLVDTNATETVMKNFRSFLQRLGRRFAGAPIYIGHPDVPGCESLYPDNKAYGWIMELHLKPDGLYGSPKWSPAGKELIENGHYKFLSPFWEASEAGFRDGRKLYRPHTLISVGLTNRPNLPMLPLSNSRRSRGSSPSHRRFVGISMEFPTGGAASAREHETDENMNNHRTESNDMKNEINNPKTEVLEAMPPIENAELESSIASLQNTVQAMDARLQELNSRFLTVLVDNAILDGRITPADREICREALDRDFPTKSLELANAERIVKVQSRDEPFAGRTASFANAQERTKHIQKVIQQKMAGGLSYDQAWEEFKAENPALISQMHTPPPGWSKVNPIQVI